ncbi:MAG: ABC transporter permease [Rhodoferax sp.]
MSPALLWSFARQELLDRYAGSALGFAWAFVQPLFMMLIYVLIFGQLMGARLPGVGSSYGYALYLMAGMLSWTAFSNTLARTASVFVDKKAILSKVGLALTTLPLFIVLAEAVTFAIGLALLAALMVVAGQAPGRDVWALPWVFLLQQMLALGLGLVLAVFNVFLRDVREAVALGVQLWFWFTPIVWAPQAVPPELYGLLRAINPMVAVVNSYQTVALDAGRPDYAQLSWVAVLAGLALAAGYALVRRMEKDIRDVI